MNDTIIVGNGFVLLKQSAIEGTGGFAAKFIPTGTRVIEYVGEKISKEESLRRCELNNRYIFDVDEACDLDGNVEWNPARFLNHSCDPNCETEVEDGQVWIVARRDIQPGEELTFDYCYDLEDYREHPCRCGSQNCVGYIVAEQFFDHIRQQRMTEIQGGM